MNKKYREALVEVLEVIHNSNEEIKNKIPQKFINFLEQNADPNYVAKIDFSNAKWKCTLKQETLSILALIYRDYIVSPEEREKLIKKEKEELAKFEMELREKYNPDDIFKNKKNRKNTV